MSSLASKLAKLQRRSVPGPHDIRAIETECPGAIQIECSCGETTWTPWGEAHAEVLLMDVGFGIVVSRRRGLAAQSVLGR